MILEGIVTTRNRDHSVHIAPMGPIIEPEMTRLILRPFQTSTTCENLLRIREGVFHVTDDVELLARAAVGQVSPIPASRPAHCVQADILTDACRWYAFRVIDADTSEPRTRLVAEVVEHGTQREFLGFNRAKHAVVEAAILATRLQLLPREEIHAEYNRLRVLVEKTAGDQERRAFEFLSQYVGFGKPSDIEVPG